MRADTPKARTLRELLAEVREGFSLYAPILIHVQGVAEDMLHSTVERTMTLSQPLDWADQYTREYASQPFVILGPNQIRSGLDGPITIGRSRRCVVKLDNDSVSKVHASLSFDRSTGDYFIVDEDSRNGTAINGEPLSARIRASIWPGAYVSFGDAVFVFLDPPTLRKLAQVGA